MDCKQKSICIGTQDFEERCNNFSLELGRIGDEINAMYFHEDDMTVENICKSQVFLPITIIGLVCLFTAWKA